MGDEFIDFGHFCKLLKADERIKNEATITAAIDKALSTMEATLKSPFREQHSLDVPDATGYNFFHVNDEWDYNYRKKDFLSLKVDHACLHTCLNTCLYTCLHTYRHMPIHTRSPGIHMSITRSSRIGSL